MVYPGRSSKYNIPYNSAYKMGVNTTKELCGICLETVIIQEKFRRKSQQSTTNNQSKNKSNTSSSKNDPQEWMPDSSCYPSIPDVHKHQFICGCPHPHQQPHEQQQTQPPKSRNYHHSNNHYSNAESATLLSAAEALVEAVFPCGVGAGVRSTTGSTACDTHKSAKTGHRRRPSSPDNRLDCTAESIIAETKHYQRNKLHEDYETRDLNAHSSSGSCRFQDREEPDYPVTGTGTDLGIIADACDNRSDLTTEGDTDIEHANTDADTEIFLNMYRLHQHSNNDDRMMMQDQQHPAAAAVDKKEPYTMILVSNPKHKSVHRSSSNGNWNINNQRHHGSNQQDLHDQQDITIRTSATLTSHRSASSQKSLLDDSSSILASSSRSHDKNQQEKQAHISAHLDEHHKAEGNLNSSTPSGGGKISKQRMNQLLQQASKEIRISSDSHHSRRPSRSHSHSHDDLQEVPSSLPPLKFDSKRSIWRETKSGAGSIGSQDEKANIAHDRYASSKPKTTSKKAQYLFHNQVVSVITMQHRQQQQQETQQQQQQQGENHQHHDDDEDEDDDMTGPRPDVEQDDDNEDGIDVFPVYTAKSQMSTTSNCVVNSNCSENKAIINDSTTKGNNDHHSGNVVLYQSRDQQKQGNYSHSNPKSPMAPTKTPNATPTNKKRERNELYVVKEQLQWTMNKLESTQYELSVLQGIKDLYQRELESKSMECKLAEWRLNYKPLVLDVNVDLDMKKTPATDNEDNETSSKKHVPCPKTTTTTTTVREDTKADENTLYPQQNKSKGKTTGNHNDFMLVAVFITCTGALVALWFYAPLLHKMVRPYYKHQLKQVFSQHLMTRMAAEAIKMKAIIYWMALEVAALCRYIALHATKWAKIAVCSAQTIGASALRHISNLNFMQNGTMKDLVYIDIHDWIIHALLWVSRGPGDFCNTVAVDAAMFQNFSVQDMVEKLWQKLAETTANNVPRLF